MGINQSRGTEQNNISIDHPKFNNSSIVKRKNLQFLRTKISNDQKSYKAWKQLLSNKKQIDNQFLLLPRAQKFQPSGICAHTGSLGIDFNNYPYLLTEEIYNRKGKKSYFHQTQLWYLLYAFISTKKHLADINGDSIGLIGDVRPSNVFINEFGQVRFSNIYSWPNQKVNYQKTFQGIRTYLSPEDMDQLHLGAMENKKNIYSQLFSVGLTLVSVGILKDCTDLYDIENFKFNLYEATKRINAFKCSSIYSQLLRAMIGNLVSYQPQKRLLLEQIWTWISKYERRILTKQPFMIDEVPSYINAQINTLRNQLTNIKSESDEGITGQIKSPRSKKSQLLNFKSNQKQTQSMNSVKQINSFKSKDLNAGEDLAVRTLKSPQAKEIFNFQRRVLIKSPQGFYQPKNIQKNGNKFKVFFQYKSPQKIFDEVHKAQTTYEKKQSNITKKAQERPSSRENRQIQQTKRQEAFNKNSPIQKVTSQQIVKQTVSQMIITQKNEPINRERNKIIQNHNKLQQINSNQSQTNHVIFTQIEQIVSENVIQHKPSQQIQQQINHQQIQQENKKTINQYNNFQISFESPPTTGEEILLQGTKGQQKGGQYFKQVKKLQHVQFNVKQHNSHTNMEDQEERIRQQIQKNLVLKLQEEDKMGIHKPQIKQSNQILILQESQHPIIQESSVQKIQQLKYQPKQIVQEIAIEKPVFQQENIHSQGKITDKIQLNQNQQQIEEQNIQNVHTISQYQKSKDFQGSQRPLIPLGPEQKHQQNQHLIIYQQGFSKQQKGLNEKYQPQFNVKQEFQKEKPIFQNENVHFEKKNSNQIDQKQNFQQHRQQQYQQNGQNLQQNGKNLQQNEKIISQREKLPTFQSSQRPLIPLGPEIIHQQITNKISNQNFNQNSGINFQKQNFEVNSFEDQKIQVVQENLNNSKALQIQNLLNNQINQNQNQQPVDKDLNQNIEKQKFQTGKQSQIQQQVHISTYSKSLIDRPLISLGPQVHHQLKAVKPQVLLQQQTVRPQINHQQQAHHQQQAVINNYQRVLKTQYVQNRINLEDANNEQLQNRLQGSKEGKQSQKDNINLSQNENFSFQRPLIPLGPQKTHLEEQVQIIKQEFEQNIVKNIELDSPQQNQQVTELKEGVETKLIQNQQNVHTSTYNKSSVDLSERPLVPLGPTQFHQQIRNSSHQQHYTNLENKQQIQNKLQQSATKQEQNHGGLAGIMERIKSNLNQKIQKLKDQQNSVEVQKTELQNNLKISHEQTPIGDLQSGSIEHYDHKNEIQQNQNKINVILADSFQSSFQNKIEENLSSQIPFIDQKDQIQNGLFNNNEHSLTSHIDNIVQGFVRNSDKANQHSHKQSNQKNNHLQQLYQNVQRKQIHVGKSQISQANLEAGNIPQNHFNTQILDNALLQEKLKNQIKNQDDNIKVTLNNNQFSPNIQLYKDEFLQNVKEINRQINAQKQQNLQVSRDSQNEGIKQSQVQFSVIKQIVGVSKQIKIQQSQNLQSKTDTVPQFSNQAQLLKQIKEKGTLNRSSFPLDSQFGNISEIMDINRQFGDTIDAKSEMNFLATIRRNEEQNQIIQELVGKTSQHHLEQNQNIIISQEDKAKIHSVVDRLVNSEQQNKFRSGKTIAQHQTEGLLITNENNLAGLMTTTPIYDQSNVQIIYSQRKTQNKTDSHAQNKDQDDRKDIIQEVKQINKQITQKHSEQDYNEPKVSKISSMQQNNNDEVINKVSKFHSLLINQEPKQEDPNLIYSNRAQISITQTPFNIAQEENYFTSQHNEIKSEEQQQHTEFIISHDFKKISQLNESEDLSNSKRENKKLLQSLKHSHKPDIIDQIIGINKELRKQTSKENNI